MSSCGQEDTSAPAGPEESGSGTVSFSFRLSKAVAAVLVRAEVVITGADMSGEIRQDLLISDDRVTGVVKGIPAGSSRLFTIDGYDASNSLIYRGSEQAEVIANQRVQVVIILKRVAEEPGENEITVTTPAGTAHEMVLVPAGEFVMGLTAEKEKRVREQEWWGDEYAGNLQAEIPAHTIYLDAYYIDKYEVTNAQYAAFLNDMGSNTGSQGFDFLDLEDENVQIWRRVLMGGSGQSIFVLMNPGLSYPDFSSEDMANLPVMEVSWYGAKAYCEWMGGRLPTEAEWEKAARGSEGRTYPWGEGLDESKAYYAGDFSFPWNRKVGSYSEGVSPYGTYDMTGNVDEWVADWYDSEYYTRSPSRNPPGPASGEWRVMRGGSWYSGQFFLRASARGASIPDRWNFSIGFRCAK